MIRSLALLWLVTAACGPSYYLVTSTLAENTHPGTSSVAASATYPTVMKHVTKVAVRAPDRCAEQTAASATGAASTAGVILQMRCGVEMADLERALARAGFTVYSWRVISDMATREKITPVAAARRVGAEVLFQVNSLEKSTAQANGELKWERHFFRSNESGYQGGPAMMSESQAQELEQMVAPDELNLVGNARLAVTVDVSAVWIETGETFWFYTWTNIEAGSSKKEARALATCGGPCSRVEMPKEKQPEPGARAGGLQEVSLTGRPANQENAIYYKLLGQTIDDLVRQFSGNVDRSKIAVAAPAPAPPPAPAPAAPPAAAPASQP